MRLTPDLQVINTAVLKAKHPADDSQFPGRYLEGGPGVGPEVVNVFFALSVPSRGVRYGKNRATVKFFFCGDWPAINMQTAPVMGCTQIRPGASLEANFYRVAVCWLDNQKIQLSKFRGHDGRPFTRIIEPFHLVRIMARKILVQLGCIFGLPFSGERNRVGWPGRVYFFPAGITSIF